MSSFLELDGSDGEGGGQILRSSLALSILTGRPFRLINIRARRPKPGLAAQHLASVRAAAAICGGSYKGGSIGSSVLYFEPGPVASGDYTFAIGTAGATGLVLHTVYLPLILKGTSSIRITITGGTHVSHSPSYHFNATTWNGYLKRLGLNVELEMTRPGFYPRGGGEIVATVHPAGAVRALHLTERPALTTCGGFAAIADLPESVGERLARRLKNKLTAAGLDSHIAVEEWRGGPSCVVAAIFRQAPVPTLFTALGERGKPAEAVADDCAAEALAYYRTEAPVDPHSADQIVLPLAFAEGESTFRTSEVTEHLRTNIATIQRFVERPITATGDVVSVL